MTVIYFPLLYTAAETKQSHLSKNAHITEKWYEERRNPIQFLFLKKHEKIHI